MKTRQMLLCFTALLLTGAAVRAVTTQQKSLASAAAAFNLPPELGQKMQRGAPLALTDVQVLAKSGVPDDTTLAYLRSTGASYQMSTEAIDQLRAAGVSDRAVNYLLLASPLRVATTPRAYAPRYGYGYRPNRGSPGFAPRFGGFGPSRRPSKWRALRRAPLNS
ncbi:MAG: hypothetical protein KAX37_03120 [Opitutaceae bacterium]|jgi:hypothetical protein|nr:hypothetical protein [Opitutaceae bacterium]